MLSSWWWIRPLPTLDKKIKIPLNQRIRASFRYKSSNRSKKLKFKTTEIKTRQNDEANAEEVKFLYESKSGKSVRRSMVLEADSISTYNKPYMEQQENR